MKPSAAEALKAAIRRSLPVTLALVLLGGIAVSAIRQLEGPRYQASARVVHSVDLGTIVSGVQPPYVDPQRVIDTATELASTPELYERAAEEGDVGDGATLQSATEVSGGADTDVLTFTCTRSGPALAVDCVNLVASEYVEWRAELSGDAVRSAIVQLEEQLEAPAGAADAVTGAERDELSAQLNRLRVLDTLNTGGATLIERAVVAEKTSPRPIRDALFGGALGLVIALLIAGVREAFNTRIRSEADVENALGRPVLASIQSLPKRSPLVTVGRHESRWGDTYALLAANIMQIRGKADRTVIAVTSAIAGEGKTTTATNLAVAMAQRGQRVILVDFDLRKPSVGRVFRIPQGSPGVVQVVDGTAELGHALWAVPLNGSGGGKAVAASNGRGDAEAVSLSGKGSLRVMAAGGNERGARIARSSQVTDFLNTLAEDADVVVLDTPPALATVEMAELSRSIDLVVTVVRYGKVTRRSLLALNRQAETWQTELVGAVITDAPPEEDDYYYDRWVALVGSVLRLGVNRTEVAHFALGAFILFLTLAASTRVGEVFSVTLLVALAVFGLVVIAFVAVPHVALATMIPLFVFLPMIKALYVPWIGPLKDVVTVAAVAAAAVTVVQASRGGRRIPGDVWILALCAFLLGLYVLNIGAGLERTWGWGHGVRLFALPLSLLLVGLTLRHPRRTLRWAMTSVVGTAVVVALVGIAQQLAGPSRLVELGWLYNVNVRTIDGFLRSFGTLDEPFAYAAVLVFGLVGTLMWAPRRPLTFAAAAVIAVGLSLSVVRSAGLIALGLVALLLARHGRMISAVFLLAVVIAATSTFILSEGATERRVVQGGPSLFYTLNGRTEAWKVVFEEPGDVPLGRGVGEVGTAANRASFQVTRSRQEALEGGKALVVDSGYFAVVADVGLVGLAGLLLLLGRLALLGHRAVGRGRPEGWIALGLVLALVLDAVTRESFTAFPTAYLALLLIGLALAAANDEPADEAPAARPTGARRRAAPRLGRAAGLRHPGPAGA